MPNILITGANSFVGTSFRRFSKIKDIHEVDMIKNKPEDIDFTGTDVVLHVAAIVHQTKNIHELEYFRVNRDMAVEVAKLAKQTGVKQFVFLSTVKVYGEFKPGMSTWNEETECIPVDDYGKSKYEAEKGLEKLQSPEFSVSIVRTPLVYGKGVRANMLNIIKLVRLLPILPLGGIQNKRNFTYIENLVGFIDRVIERNASGIFIAMDDGTLSTTHLVKIISAALNKKRVLFRIPGFLLKAGKAVLPVIFDRLYGSFELNNNKTREILNYCPPVSSEEGVRRTVHSLY